MTRHWSINGRFVTQPVSGVQRYAREIVGAMDRLIGEGHPLARGLTVELLVPPDAGTLPGLHAIRSRTVGRRSGGHVWEQLTLPSAVRGGLLSLGNTGPLAVPRHIVCIHDVNTRLVPDSYGLRFRLLYRALLPALGRCTQQVTTVSQASAEALARYGIAAAERIDVMPNGHEHALRWTPRHSAATRRAAGLSTVVLVGSPAPHKNVGLVLGLADRLGAAGLSIAVAGLRDARVFADRGDGGSGAHIAWLGRLSDDALAALLRDSLCLAFPSFAEGFGLPALEAMVWGCPVVASDRTSLPEVCGAAALYAPPAAADLWLGHFLRLARDEALRADLVARGRVQAARFSWQQSAEGYLRAMARADGVECSNY